MMHGAVIILEYNYWEVLVHFLWSSNCAASPLLESARTGAQSAQSFHHLATMCGSGSACFSKKRHVLYIFFWMMDGCDRCVPHHHDSFPYLTQIGKSMSGTGRRFAYEMIQSYSSHDPNSLRQRSHLLTHAVLFSPARWWIERFCCIIFRSCLLRCYCALCSNHILMLNSSHWKCRT